MATAAKQQTASTVRGSATSSSSGPSKSKSSSPSAILPGVGKSQFQNQQSNFLDTEEDIATIAKQISDHAEAIYQTWKARGLAPTEILNCHTATNDAFGKALTPPLRNSLDSSSSPVVAEFLAQAPDMSNNNLEKLVSSFVNEDKARQQAARKQNSLSSSTTTTSSTTSSGPTTPSILTSGTIKDALRKFESNTSSSGYTKPSFLVKNSNAKTTTFQKTSSPQPSPTSTSSTTSLITTGTQSLERKKILSGNNTVFVQKSTSIQQNSTTTTTKTTTQLNKNVPDVLMDTINQPKQQLPKDNNGQLNKTTTSLQPNTSLSTSSSYSSSSSPSSSLTSSSSLSTTSLSTMPLSSLLSSSAASASSTASTPSTNFIGSSSSGIISNNNINSNSIGSISTNSSSSLSSNIKKPQTPAKPANLINHTPTWPLKNRISVGSSVGIGTPNSATIKNGVKNGDDTSKTIKSIEFGKNSSSAELLDEVSREEERLINALKTGIVLNNNDKNNKLPEVIQSALNSSDKHDSKLINSNNTRNKPGGSSTTSKSSQGLSKVAGKASLLSLSSLSSSSSSSPSPLPSTQISSSPEFASGATTAATTSTTTATPAATTATTIATATITTPSPLTGNNPPSSWNDDRTKPDDKILTTASLQTTPIPSITPLNNIHKLEIMSPAQAPAPTKIKLRPKNDAAVPHPEAKMNSNTHNSYVNSRTNVVINPVRPFLTRGSVAERVLMFEKCPDVKAPLRNINRDSSKVATKPLAKPASQTHTTLQRHIRSSSKNVYIPRFHFPHGKPQPTITVETTLQRLVSAFDSFPNNQVSKEDFHLILKICQLPFYWRMPLMACAQHATSGLVDGYRFIDFWKQLSVYCHDTASRFVYILSRGQRSRPYILHEDLASLVQDVVDTHPGLAFLKEASEFHSRYVHTVIARIFYSVNRSWSGRISVPELRRSNLMQVIQLLEEEEDINQIMAFFSYEHFYVIYCKFWELDRDHDLFIDQNDLARHNDHALSTRIIERIFSGCVTRGGKTRITGPTGPKMSYTDFVWFLLSEEDKNNPTAIEYWFRCMDLDGDGIVSMYELEYFYEEQQQRMESIGIETLPFEDCLCQMLDMIKPVKPGCITLGDLKRCRMTPIFYDTFFNLEKYLEHEQRDPFATQRDNDDMTDWDRYAAQEYELLVAEEGGDTQGSYDEDEDYESNIDILESQLDDMSNMINEW